MALLKAIPGSVGLRSMTLFLDSSFHVLLQFQVGMFPCSEDDPASPVYLPLCLSSPPEGSLGLSPAQPLMEGELSVAGRVE